MLISSVKLATLMSITIVILTLIVRITSLRLCGRLSFRAKTPSFHSAA